GSGFDSNPMSTPAAGRSRRMISWDSCEILFPHLASNSLRGSPDEREPSSRHRLDSWERGHGERRPGPGAVGADTGMYERFTDRARKVMQLANQEAQRFNHEYIGTEHILLGLVKEGTGVAANVLKNLDIDLRKIRLEVEKIVQAGPDMVTMGKLPQ